MAAIAPVPTNHDAPSSAALCMGVSLRSRVGLNAANFFLAEMTGVVMPFVNDFLRSRQWRYDTIGVATSLAGFGVLLIQAPAGWIVDHTLRRRQLLAVTSVVLGVAYGLLPVVPARSWAVDPLLFTAGVGGAFFPPLLAALALGLVGRARLNRTVGVNQGWNHAGNVAAALTAMVLVSRLPLASVFYAVAVVSLIAAGAVFLIRADELRDAGGENGASIDDGGGRWPRFGSVLRDQRVVVLFIASALFHLANAPVMPLVALYVKHLDGSDTQVAAVVLVAQAVMIPVALLAGRLCDAWGRRPMFIVGFLTLPVRIFLYSLTRDSRTLVALQALDGIGAGIYGVAVVAICADLTRGKGGFNTLLGVIGAAVSLGGVIGPLASGVLVQHLGFMAAFDAFAGVAVLAAVLFMVHMPETRPAEARLEAKPANVRTTARDGVPRVLSESGPWS